MAGSNENGAVVGDWNPVNPNPRTLISSYPNVGLDLGTDVSKNQDEGRDDDQDDGFRFSSTPFPPQHGGGFGSQCHGLRSGLAERKAKAGFSAPTLDTTRNSLGRMDGSSLDIQSPYVTIPPGLSPTMLLESPVFLSNSMAQTSPTTGKLQFGKLNNTNPDTAIVIPHNTGDHQLEDVVTESFAFKPPLESSSSFFIGAENKAPLSIEHKTSPSCGEVLTRSEQPCVDLKNLQSFKLDLGVRRETTKDSTFSQQMANSFFGNDHFSPPEEQHDGDGQQKVEFSSVAVGAPQDDGYNWRKYGQKQVKGSEYPRSYYKCTHPSCQVKKKVERSHEGHITEIIYKGKHNHPLPPPSRRSGMNHPYGDMPFDGLEQHGPQASFDGQPLWNNAQEWRNDGSDANQSSSVPYVDSSVPMAVHDGSRFEPTDVVDVSTTMSNDEDDDDRATHGSVSHGGEGEEDESESKRRKLDAAAMEISAASRTVREPRVVVQTTSEVDILDDGYRWRKYGQKVVKGNPNPRSYYKCTNPGCTVRKHVERASHDLKSVITTYEGKHNHDVPAARNSGNSGAGSASSVVVLPSASQSHILHRRPDPAQLQDSMMRFDNSSHVPPFGLTGREPQQQQLGPPARFSFGMGQQQSLGNLPPIPGLGQMAPLKMPMGGLPPYHTYMGDHRPTMGSGFLVPKGEMKEEPVSETGLPMTNGGSSAYHQAMGRFSLGPHL